MFELPVSPAPIQKNLASRVGFCYTYGKPKGKKGSISSMGNFLFWKIRLRDFLMWAATLSALFLPQAIGLFSLLYLDKKNHKLSTTIYYVMIALSIIPCLYMLTIGFGWSLGAYKGVEFARGFIYVGWPILLVAQLVLFVLFFKKAKTRKIIYLTLLSTPALIYILMNLTANLFGEGIYIC
jgi:hypothetical protein